MVQITRPHFKRIQTYQHFQLFPTPQTWFFHFLPYLLKHIPIFFLFAVILLIIIFNLYPFILFYPTHPILAPIINLPLPHILPHHPDLPHQILDYRRYPTTDLCHKDLPLDSICNGFLSRFEYTSSIRHLFSRVEWDMVSWRMAWYHG